MTDDKQIRGLVQIYFDSMYESNPDKVYQAFHPNAKITGFLQGDLQELSVAAFSELIGSQQPSAKEKGEAPVLEILSIEIAGDTAVARVRDVCIGLVFLDTLSLIRTEGNWRIYNKLFHVERDA